jgi:hypothetical protein
MSCNPCVLVYIPAVLYGYDIRCKHCGETYGFSSDRDMRYLAGLNRNRRRVAGKRSKKARRVIAGAASMRRRATPRRQPRSGAGR